MSPHLDQHYWSHVAHAEELIAQLQALAGQDTQQILNRRQVLASELESIELHILRELLEAGIMAVGHRIVPD